MLYLSLARTVTRTRTIYKTRIHMYRETRTCTHARAEIKYTLHLGINTHIHEHGYRPT